MDFVKLHETLTGERYVAHPASKDRPNLPAPSGVMESNTEPKGAAEGRRPADTDR